MLVIRLARRGAKNQPFYEVVVAEKTSPRDGKFVEKIGYVNPIAQGKAVKSHLDLDRLDYWIKNGAQMSERVEEVVKQYKKDQAKQSA